MEAAPSVVHAPGTGNARVGRGTAGQRFAARAHPRPACRDRQAVRQAADPDASRHRLPHGRSGCASTGVGFAAASSSRLRCSGFGLTALFAVATVHLRTRLEDQLINSTLPREAQATSSSSSATIPIRTRTFSMSLIAAADRARRTHRDGAVRVAELRYRRLRHRGDRGARARSARTSWRSTRTTDYWAYLRFDVSTQKLERAPAADRAWSRRCSCSRSSRWLIGVWSVGARDEPGDRPGAARARD